ncbi:hypothetical protein [Mesorhizobium sp. 1M-11]|uniref:hypothetical protein n=1 Tax=Mesorhizobium sp. 1M-11 TaxID=1529006 RepID=UPI0006C75C7A|nr:hypothetical protein [Mesorhizobium sp. 1M-11]
MWLELTDQNGVAVAVNFDNIVYMNSLEKTGHTELWSTVARSDHYQVWVVKDTITDILARLRMPKKPARQSA